MTKALTKEEKSAILVKEKQASESVAVGIDCGVGTTGHSLDDPVSATLVGEDLNSIRTVEQYEDPTFRAFGGQTNFLNQQSSFMMENIASNFQTSQ